MTFIKLKQRTACIAVHSDKGFYRPITESLEAEENTAERRKPEA